MQQLPSHHPKQTPPPQSPFARLLIVSLWIIILAALATALFKPSIFSFRQHHSRTHAQELAHLREISSYLHSMHADYGYYPTHQPHQLSNIPLASPPSSSNDYFRQLFLTGIAQAESEQYFHSPTLNLPKSHPADNIIHDSQGILHPPAILPAGTCSYLYVAGHNSQSPEHAPIVLDSPSHGNIHAPYTSKRPDQTVLVLRLDNSILPYHLSPHPPHSITQKPPNQSTNPTIETTTTKTNAPQNSPPNNHQTIDILDLSAREIYGPNAHNLLLAPPE